jgi:hypothetical protein
LEFQGLKEVAHAGGGNPGTPCEKVAELVRSGLDPVSKIAGRGSAPEAGDANGLMVVEGTVNGHPHRVLIQESGGTETRIGRDMIRLSALKTSLVANAAFLCLPSAAPGEILLLAQRLGIFTTECADGKESMQVHLGSVTVVRHVSVQSWAFTLYPSLIAGQGFSFDDKNEDLTVRGRPVRNWLCRESRKLIQKPDQDCLISVRYRLKGHIAFETQGKTIDAQALGAWFKCAIRNRAHSAKAGLDTVKYHPRLGKILASTGKSAGAGEERIPGLMLEDAPLLGRIPSIKPEMHIYHPVAGASTPGMPDLSREILSEKIQIKEE